MENMRGAATGIGVDDSDASALRARIDSENAGHW